MRLPEELVRIVKEYSMPLLRYPSDYKLALVTTNRVEWPVLKQKLSSPDADQVVKALRVYLVSKTNAQTCLDRYNTEVFYNDDCELSMEERSGMARKWIDAIMNELAMRRILEALIE